jgi:L-2-hydroxyglutarate oxidase LhgO
MTRNLVIIGGGTAGPTTAAEVKRIDPEVNITVIESSEYIAPAT